MDREDYDLVLIMLGVATGTGRILPRRKCLELLNRLNSGNPHYTPYQVEAEKK